MLSDDAALAKFSQAQSFRACHSWSGGGQREHRPFQWPLVSLVTRGTLQIRIQFVRQRRDPTLKTNKQTKPPMTTTLPFYVERQRCFGKVLSSTKFPGMSFILLHNLFLLICSSSVTFLLINFSWSIPLGPFLLLHSS